MDKFSAWLKVLLLITVSIYVAACQSGGGLRYEPEASETLIVQPAGVYLDFEDIQIPEGLKLQRKKSYVYQTESVKTGVLVFKTSRSVNEIVGYFESNMTKDNWVLESNFKFHRNILLFTKPNKNCLIIVEKDPDSLKVLVEIWVSPQGLAKDKDSDKSSQ